MTPLYVYWLRAPMLRNAVVYVGCSHNPAARRRHAQKRYNMVLTMKYSKPYGEEHAAKFRETAEIEKYWLTVFNLASKSCVPKDYGVTIPKMSAAAKLRGVNSNATAAAAKVNKGKTFSKERRKAMSISLKGVPHLKARGVKFTLDHCTKIGDGNRRRVWTLESREKQRSNIASKSLMTLWNVWQKLEAVARKAEKEAERSGKKSDLRKATHTRKIADKVGKQRAELRRSRGCEDKALLQSGYGHPWRVKDLDQQTRETIG